jgi:hypothetical protein
MYMEAFNSFFPPKKLDDGSYAITFNMGSDKLALVAVVDIGIAAAKIFANPKTIN